MKQKDNQQNKKLEVSIIMPCLNESETIEICIRKAFQKLNELKISGEVIIADNGSDDGSQELALNVGAKIIHVAEKGYGSALMGGIKEAKGKYIIMGDADDSYNFLEIEPFIKELKNGYDLVIGNRLKGGIQNGAMPFLHRYFGNPVLSFIGRAFFKIPVGDFHCGLRAFSKEAYDKMQLKSKGMEFASEMVIKAAFSNLKIAEIPVKLYPDGRSRRPHLRTWQDGWHHLRFLLLYAPHWLFLFPGLFLIISNILLSAKLIISPIRFGSIRLSLHTLLYTTTFLQIGFQFLFFYIIIKTYAYYHEILPIKPKEKKFISLFNLEKGLIIGSIVFIIGIAISIINLSKWEGKEFGNLNPEQFMPFVILAVSCLYIGMQIIISSFIISIIQKRNI